MKSNEGFAEVAPLAATLGIVYRDLAHHMPVMRALTTSKSVQSVEFSVQAPLYKGSTRIINALEKGNGLADKIDAYFKYCFVDEDERLRYRKLFEQQYSKKHPRVERSDLFLASGDVFAFSFDLVPPMQLDVPREAFDAIAAGPHESAMLGRVRGGDAPEKWHLKVQIRLFLDHVLNPRHHDLPAVRDAAKDVGAEQPYVLEVSASPSIPGYARYVLEPLVMEAGGRMVWLDA